MKQKIFLTDRIASQVSFCVHDEVVCEVKKTYQPFFYGLSSVELSLAARFCVMDWLLKNKDKDGDKKEVFISIFDPIESEICMGHFKVICQAGDKPGIESCIRIE